MGELARFYWPLAGTSILRQSTRSILNAGIALALMAKASLAAWPVAWGLSILIAGPAWSLQQLTTALAEDEASYCQVRRFALALGALFTLLLALVTFTPLYDWVMGGIYNLSPELQRIAQPAMYVMVIYPLLMGAQSLLRGRMIHDGHTPTVQGAMALNVAVVSVTIFSGAALLPLTGVVLAAIATVAGALVELVVLRWRASQAGTACLSQPA
jgi:hypothetical protein